MTQREAFGDMISLAWAMTSAMSMQSDLDEFQRKHIAEAIDRIEAARELWRTETNQ